MALLFRLNGGVTFDQAEAAERQDTTGAAFIKLVTPYGGANPVPSGKTQLVVNRLPEGSYVMACFIPSPDGQFHSRKGMFQPLTVKGTAPKAPEPRTVGEVILKDFSFELPPTFTSGRGIFKVTNRGPQPHELGLAKLAEGKTLADFQDFLQQAGKALASGTPLPGPPPFEDSGGIGPMASGTSGFVFLNLEPGNYVALCLVPDTGKGGMPHAAEGMLTEFRVGR